MLYSVDPMTWDQGSWTKDLGPRTWDQGPGTKDLGPRTWGQGPGTKDPGPRTWDLKWLIPYEYHWTGMVEWNGNRLWNFKNVQ